MQRANKALQACKTKEAEIQIGDKVRYVKGFLPLPRNPGYMDSMFGQVGTIVEIFTPAESMKRTRSKKTTHVVVFDDWYLDSRYYFDPNDLRLFKGSHESFWDLYQSRRKAHCGEVRRRANHACNLRRRHKKEAIKIAMSCHLLNLLLSAHDQPPGFKRTRLDLQDFVDLCLASGKEMLVVTDILFHLFFENKEPMQIGVLPCCTCWHDLEKGQRVRVVFSEIKEQADCVGKIGVVYRRMLGDEARERTGDYGRKYVLSNEDGKGTLGTFRVNELKVI